MRYLLAYTATTLDRRGRARFHCRKVVRTSSGDTRRCRLVALWDEAGGDYHLYLTHSALEVRAPRRRPGSTRCAGRSSWS